MNDLERIKDLEDKLRITLNLERTSASKPKYTF